MNKYSYIFIIDEYFYLYNLKIFINNMNLYNMCKNHICCILIYLYINIYKLSLHMLAKVDLQYLLYSLTLDGLGGTAQLIQPVFVFSR
jgi:hypothetical protein